MSHQRTLFFFRFGGSILRTFFPIIRFKDLYLVSRYDDVVQVLRQDEDFTIRQINAENIDRHTGKFVLGMDHSPQEEREHAILRKAVHREDPVRIRKIVADAAAELVEEVRKSGKGSIDVVEDLARVVPIRLLTDYFGTPGPDLETMQWWMRIIFYDVFLNFSGDSEIRAKASKASAELKVYLDQLIAQRKGEIKDGKPVPDDFLVRLIQMQDDPETHLDDEGVRRNVSGVILGAVDTISKSVTTAADQLLRREKDWKGAQAAAQKDDIDLVSKYAFEAMRFDPHNPILLRHCEKDVTITRSNGKKKTFKGGNKVIPITMSAMFDSREFKQPGKFRIDREYSKYIHFGYGMHRCFGEYVNVIEIPEIFRALLKLPNLKRAKGKSGQVEYDSTGAFPDHLILEFG